jgi:type IV fimbrial biogenesis protein FimT
MLELMIVTTIATIVLSIGIPSFTQMVQNNRVITQTNTLLGTLNMARAEALKSNTQVTVCKSNDNANCNIGLNWQDGWVVFVDDDANGTRGGGETLLWTQPELDGANTLRSNSFDNFIAFAPNGMSIGSTANAGVFRLCDDRGIAEAMDITVTRTGSSSSADAIGGAC